MSKLKVFTIIVVAFLAQARAVHGQSEIPTRVTSQNRTGELPFTTNIGTAIEHVDGATGTLNVRIPIISTPGRGMDASLYFQFNSNYFLLAPRIDGLGHPFWLW